MTPLFVFVFSESSDAPLAERCLPFREEDLRFSCFTNANGGAEVAAGFKEARCVLLFLSEGTFFFKESKLFLVLEQAVREKKGIVAVLLAPVSERDLEGLGEKERADLEGLLSSSCIRAEDFGDFSSLRKEIASRLRKKTASELEKEAAERRELGKKLLKEGEEHYFSKEYALALEKLLKAYECGNKNAASFLGSIYYNGSREEGIEPDLTEAWKYFQIGDSIDDGYSQFIIAWYYEEGLDGKKVDQERCVSNLLKASKNGQNIVWGSITAKEKEWRKTSKAPTTVTFQRPLPASRKL